MTAVSPDLSAALAGRYTIERELGRGGMATVYLAHDIKHDRKVAIKVLDPELGAVLGAERFLSEIKVTANLQHPNLLPLFDSGEANGLLYYVMPFVEGETLRSRLDREKQLPIEESVRIAVAVANALSYAHERGVIHRDLKPENILFQAGQPVVADFGIALAVSNAGGQRVTQTGLSLGTPQYMSPEQATGDRAIDGRTDIYSLGAVTYEMLTGEPPFTGPTAQAVIARLMTGEPEAVRALRKTVPPHVAAAVHHALHKLPADRFENAKALGDALTNPSFASSTLVGRAAAPPGSLWRQRAAVPHAIVTIALLGLASWGWLRHPPTPLVARLDLNLGALTPGTNGDVIVSPDGSTLAFTGTVNGERAIYARRLDGDPTFRKVAGTDDATGWPAFSPDNQWIAFKRIGDSALIKVATGGGSATTLARAVTGMSYMHWGTSDQIISSARTSLNRLPAAGGQPEPLAFGSINRFSFLLPDGSGVLYSQGSSQGSNVMLFDLRTKKSTMLIKNAIDPMYAETGHLLYIEPEGGLFAVPFDLRSHELHGSRVRVLDRVGGTPTTRGYSLSRNGVLVYRDAPPARDRGALGALFAVQSLAGGADTLPLPRMVRGSPRFSPDGHSIAYGTAPATSPVGSDIYTFDLVTGTHTQLTSSGDASMPVWSADGKRILFTKGHQSDGDLYVKPVDNSAPAQLVLGRPGLQIATAWLADGRILFESLEGDQYDLYTLSPNDRIPKPYLKAPWNERNAEISHDGKLAVFESSELGNRGDIWIREFPTPQNKWRVSTAGGLAPRWSPDGQYVYFWKPAPEPTPDTLFRARVERTPAILVHAPERVMTVNIIGGLTNWDIHPDGKRVIVTVGATALANADAGNGAVSAPDAQYRVILNWFTELQARMNKEKK